MCMISNNDIQEAIISKLKATPAVLALVPAVEIRETQWQGLDFTYPCIRVRVGPQVPTADVACTISRCQIVIQCYSENASSKESNSIAFSVVDALHGKPFSTTNMKFTMLKVVTLSEAIRRDQRTWVATATFTALVQS